MLTHDTRQFYKEKKEKALCAEMLGSPINELIFMILMREEKAKKKPK